MFINANLRSILAQRILQVQDSVEKVKHDRASFINNVQMQMATMANDVSATKTFDFIGMEKEANKVEKIATMIYRIEQFDPNSKVI